jgi:hypothetical protein
MLSVAWVVVLEVRTDETTEPALTAAPTHQPRLDVRLASPRRTTPGGQRRAWYAVGRPGAGTKATSPGYPEPADDPFCRCGAGWAVAPCQPGPGASFRPASPRRRHVSVEDTSASKRPKKAAGRRRLAWITSVTRLEITRPQRSPKPSWFTSKTPESGLKISAASATTATGGLHPFAQGPAPLLRCRSRRL